MNKPEPVTLRHAHVRLEPLSTAHVGALAEVGLDAALWSWIPAPLKSVDDMRAYVERALDEQARGQSLPFAIVDARAERVVGSTRYAAIDTANERVEIGWTWIARDVQRSAVNTSAKRLLLGHAFEVLVANRVELKTDVLNQQSRTAILRLGATQEGILRQHVRCVSGRLRDTVYFSILASEWPDVRCRLDERLATTH